MIFKYFFGTVLVIVTFFSFFGCSGWSLAGEKAYCFISFLEPSYNYFYSLILTLAFTSFLWLPILLLLQIIVSYFKNRSKNDIPHGNPIANKEISATEDKKLKNSILLKWWWVWLIIINIISPIVWPYISYIFYLIK